MGFLSDLTSSLVGGSGSILLTYMAYQCISSGRDFTVSEVMIPLLMGCAASPIAYSLPEVWFWWGIRWPGIEDLKSSLSAGWDIRWKGFARMSNLTFNMWCLDELKAKTAGFTLGDPYLIMWCFVRLYIGSMLTEACIHGLQNFNESDQVFIFFMGYR